MKRRFLKAYNCYGKGVTQFAQYFNLCNFICGMCLLMIAYYF